MKFNLYTLNDISIKIYSGGTPSRKEKSYWANGNIPWLKTNLIGKYKIYDTEEYITELGLENSSAKMLKPNTLTIAMYGDGVTRGKVSIVAKPMTTNQACCNIEIDPAKADYMYVYYLLKNSYSKLRRMSNGGAQQNLNVKLIKEFEVGLPALEEQKRISNILKSLDEKIGSNEKLIDNYEKLAEALFKGWFIDFEFPDDNDQLYKSNGGKMVSTEIGIIPERWKSSYLGDLITEQKVKNKEEKEYPVLTVIKEGRFITSDDFFDKQVYSKKLNNYKLINRFEVGFNPSRANIGSIALLREYEVGLLSPAYKIFKIKDKLTPEYIFYLMKTTYFKEFVKSNSVGTTRQNLDLKSFDSYPIPVPPNDLLSKFSRVINTIWNSVNELKVENEKLASLRDNISFEFLSGEVEFPSDTEVISHVPVS